MANIAQAIRLGLHVGESRLGVTNIFGEDVGPPLGGVFTCTQGLKTTWNSPLDERGIIGTAFGLGLAGQRTVAEIQFCDYIFNTIDLLKLVGNCSWSTMGQYNVPIVVMTPVGSGIHGSLYHSHSFDAMMTHLPGWKIVLPSTPIDTYGLLISAIKDDNPVMFMYPKALVRPQGVDKIPGEPKDARELSRMIDAPLGEARKGWAPRWPELPDFEIEIGKANKLTEGGDVTVATYGRTAPLAAKVATKLAGEGIEAEVIDLRSLWPWDRDMVFESVKKTGRFIALNEDVEVTNFGEHLIREVTKECFYHLEAPPTLVAGANTPGIGLAWTLESQQVPQEEQIEAALRSVAATKA